MPDPGPDPAERTIGGRKLRPGRPGEPNPGYANWSPRRCTEADRPDRTGPQNGWTDSNGGENAAPGTRPADPGPDSRRGRLSDRCG